LSQVRCLRFAGFAKNNALFVISVDGRAHFRREDGRGIRWAIDRRRA
jgi:hypothetical protein